MTSLEDRYLKFRLKTWVNKHRPPASGKMLLIRDASGLTRRRPRKESCFVSNEPLLIAYFQWHHSNNFISIGSMIYNYQAVALNLRLL
jgi:hypothetical protein